MVRFGQYTFADRVASYEAGTVAMSTKLPLTVIAGVIVLSFYLGKAIRPMIGPRMTTIVSVLWLLSMPAIILVILLNYFITWFFYRQ